MKYIILLLLIFYLYKFVDATDKISFLDIQTNASFIGDAIVIQSTENEKNVYSMIDTGKANRNSYNKILNFLHDNNISELKWILLSHNHNDHVSGLNHIINYNVTIEAVYTKKYQAFDSKNNDYDNIDEYRKNNLIKWNNIIDNLKSHNVDIKYITENENNYLDLGNYHFELLNLKEAFYGFEGICKELKKCNENTNSVIAVGKNNGRYYYLNGDIDTYPTDFSKSKNKTLSDAYYQNTVDKWVKRALDVYDIEHFDVYKVSHHGTLYNNIENTFILSKPDICIVTNAENRYYDRFELRDRIYAGNSNSEIYYTGNGIVTINQDEYGYLTVSQGEDQHNDPPLNDLPSDSKIKWFYNMSTKKCLAAPSKSGYRPVIQNCDNNYSKWIVSSDGYFYSSAVNSTILSSLMISSNGSITIRDYPNRTNLFYDKEKNLITSPNLQNKCLDKLKSEQSNNNTKIKLFMNECDNSEEQYWSDWDFSPTNIETVWIYNENEKKCLYAPNNDKYRPTLKTCDNSNNYKWLVSLKNKSYIRSLAKPYRCLWIKDEEKGTVIMSNCDNKAIWNKINNVTLTSDRAKGKCLGFFQSDDKKEKLNLNPCNKNLKDQNFKISYKNPYPKNKNYKLY